MPATPEHRAVLLVVERASGPAELHARAIAADGTIEALSLPLDAPLSVSALLYAEPLEELGLTAGPVPVLAAGRAVPATSDVWTARADGGVAGAWQASSIDAPVIAALRIEDVAPCSVFEETRIELPTFAEAQFVERVTERGVLVGTEDDELFYVERAGATQVAAPPGRLGMSLTFFGAYLDEGGEIWLGADLGGIWRGRLVPRGCDAVVDPCRELEAAEVGILTKSDKVFGVAGPSSGVPRELFALTEEGAVERFDGAMWSRIHDLSGSPRYTFRGAIAWLDASETIFASIRDGHVLRWVSGAVQVEELPRSEDAAVTALVHAPGYGTIAGDERGALFAHLGGTWTELPIRATAGVRDLAVRGRGFVWSDDDGAVGQHVPGGARCAPTVPASVGDTKPHATIVGASVVLAGQSSLGHLAVRWLDPSSD
ncbi:hypothetical protein L6R52_26645 [Myxococcota bacterium]|nr:hypothetical protein [Myxococcota bacterium]